VVIFYSDQAIFKSRTKTVVFPMPLTKKLGAPFMRIVFLVGILLWPMAVFSVENQEKHDCDVGVFEPLEEVTSRAVLTRSYGSSVDVSQVDEVLQLMVRSRVNLSVEDMDVEMFELCTLGSNSACSFFEPEEIADASEFEFEGIESVELYVSESGDLHREQLSTQPNYILFDDVLSVILKNHFVANDPDDQYEDFLGLPIKNLISWKFRSCGSIEQSLS
jgi:hypothetical protein